MTFLFLFGLSTTNTNHTSELHSPKTKLTDYLSNHTLRSAQAFNTFIDDLFAFIITMPTAHRVACFRDDLVFVVYLYQRWLYPVDETRLDAAASFAESSEVAPQSKAAAQQKKKQ